MRLGRVVYTRQHDLPDGTIVGACCRHQVLGLVGSRVLLMSVTSPAGDIVRQRVWIICDDGRLLLWPESSRVLLVTP